ncbi:hypothetical protein HBO08_24555 [Pseudomonas rhodesiae]|uniref:hypothetical protein n=1 Tax=Pseudomonas rhodesiae TaxID=76760 RepID=UPI001475D72B|nr:hypothetical protein [Pseudomonas rhodesiae]NMZ20184.1 hypothetical protein [Pseudomonas rhodesiae]
METKNNPTGRLFDILEDVRSKPNAYSSRKVWASAFDCDPSNTGEILGSLADLIRLVAEAKEATVKFIPGDVALFLAPFPKIESMLSRVHFDATWEQSRAHLDDNTMSGLAFGNHALTPFYGKNVLREDSIAEFIAQLNELLQQCLASDLPPELQKLFMKNLEGLRHALMAYRISGARGLEAELDRAVGSLIRHHEEIKSASSDPQAKAYTAQVFDIISKLNDSVQFVQNAVALAGPTANSITLLLNQLSS